MLIKCKVIKKKTNMTGSSSILWPRNNMGWSHMESRSSQDGHRKTFWDGPKMVKMVAKRIGTSFGQTAAPNRLDNVLTLFRRYPVLKRVWDGLRKVLER